MNTIFTAGTKSSNSHKPIYQRHLENQMIQAGIDIYDTFTTPFQQKRHQALMSKEGRAFISKMISHQPFKKPAGGTDNAVSTSKIYSDMQETVDEEKIKAIAYEMSIAEVLTPQELQDYPEYGICSTFKGHEIANPSKTFERHIVGLGPAFHDQGEIQYISILARQLVDKSCIPNPTISLYGKTFKITDITRYDPGF